jgi:hypothetical protein
MGQNQFIYRLMEACMRISQISALQCNLAIFTKWIKEKIHYFLSLLVNNITDKELLNRVGNTIRYPVMPILYFPRIAKENHPSGLPDFWMLPYGSLLRLLFLPKGWTIENRGIFRSTNFAWYHIVNHAQKLCFQVIFEIKGTKLEGNLYPLAYNVYIAHGQDDALID